MADVAVALSPDPIYLQGSGADPTSYDANADRKFMQDAVSPGVRDATHFEFSTVGGMVAEVTSGVAYILGQNVADQGMYRQYVGTDTSITAPAAHGSLPRVDSVILRVMDYTHDNNGGGLFEGRLEWIEGTATSGATLDNRTGAPDLTALDDNSKSVLWLGDYLMAASTSSLSLGNFRDKRRRSVIGGGSAIGSARVPGEIAAWPSSVLPDADRWGIWLWCDGASYLRTEYEDLFNHIGGASSPWGLPDSTHFNVPNGIGRTFWGRNPSVSVIDAIGDNEGSAVGVRGPIHRHTVDATLSQTPHSHSYTDPGGSFGTGGAGGVSGPNSSQQTGAQNANLSLSVAVGPSGWTTDMPAFFTGNWIIFGK